MEKRTKIMIGGSMSFAKEMKEAQKILEDMGYEVFVPVDMEHVIEIKDKGDGSLLNREFGFLNLF